jgi:hypothetical protein
MPASTTLLIDSDIFVQLAGADALEEAVAALGLSWGQCRRMDALPGMLKGGRFGCSEAARNRALMACLLVAPIEERSDAREVKKLLLGAIDPGELLALAQLSEDPNALFLSGDLRWMRAVNKPRYQSVRDKIAGRVLCLETLLVILLESYGAAWVVRHFGADTQYKTLKIIFPLGAETPERDAIEGINSYNEDRKREIGMDFFYLSGLGQQE